MIKLFLLHAKIARPYGLRFGSLQKDQSSFLSFLSLLESHNFDSLLSIDYSRIYDCFPKTPDDDECKKSDFIIRILTLFPEFKLNSQILNLRIEFFLKTNCSDCFFKKNKNQKKCSWVGGSEPQKYFLSSPFSFFS